MEHGRALRRAAGAVHGVDLDGAAVEVAGRTDAAIARDLLRAAGVADAAIDARAAEVPPPWSRPTRRPDLSHTVAPGRAGGARGPRGGARAATGSRSSPATSSRSRTASSRRAGIGHFFPRGQGGFGSDAEERGELPAIARARAGGWARERTVVIGDTPRDIACARVDRVRVIAVATGPFTAQDLAGADAVVDDARAALPVLADWAAA